VTIATCQPRPTSPTVASGGSTTSSKKISLNPDPPFICRSGSILIPGECMSTTNMVSPACRVESGSLRARSSPKSQYWAPDVQILWPRTSHEPSNWRAARVRMPATSEPAPGSENIWHQISSPRSIGRMYRSFCSGVPADSTVGPHMPRPIRNGKTGRSYCSLSWLNTTCSRFDRPCPPYSGGQEIPV
jgi:hypothetical protein